MSWETIVKDNNLDVSVIPFNEMIGRLDAEYFRPLYQQYEKRIEKIGYKEVHSFATITDGIHSSIDFDEQSEINLLSAMSPKDNYFDISKNKMISVSQHKKNPRTELKKDDVIVSTVGTIGNCAVVDETVLPANSDRHIGIIRIKSEYLPHFLSTFLVTKYGRFQTLREATGNVQLNLFIEKIRTLKIPLASKTVQTRVSDTVIKALMLREKGKSEYASAENILLKELGLDKHIASELSVSIRNLIECLRDDRFDAEYWQPEYDAMEKAVSKVSQKELGEIVSLSKGVEVGSEAYDPEGKPFIRVSDFSIYGIEDVEKKISPELYEELKDKYTPKKGEVLFTKDGTIGLSYALHEDTVGILSGAFLRLKPTIKINTDYLALVLNSLYCKTQIERMSGGAIIAHLKPESAKKIKIPLLSDAKQAEIADKVSTAFRMRKEAKELLEKAKQSVEIFIEKDEKEALSYLNSRA